MLVYLAMPAGVMTASDDFGYFRSIVETLQRGRPWTDEWLEPWSASFSSLAAVGYLLTGSFQMATYGLAALLGGTSFAFLALWWRSRGLSAIAACAATAGLLLFPTIFWKEVDYTGVILHVPCLLAAIWFSEKRQWKWFAVVWIIALANRQSALTWLAIPGLALLGQCRAKNRSTPRAWQAPLLVIVLGVMAFVALTVAMNKTHAQTVITAHLFDRFDRGRLDRALLAGAGVYAIAVGCGGFLLGLRKNPADRWLRDWRWWQPGIALAGTGLFLVSVRPYVFFEHPGCDYGYYSLVLLRLVLGLSLLGWLRPNLNLDLRKAVFALAALTPIALRGEIWDYYLIDAAVFGLMTVGRGAVEISAAEGRFDLSFRRFLWAPLAVVLGLQFYTIWRFKITIDQTAVIGRITERAIREGRLAPNEAGHTNIGFEGWHLHRYFIAHEGRTDGNLVGFIRYRDSGTVSLRHSVPEAVTGQASNPAWIGMEVSRVGWFSREQCTLTRAKPRASGPVVAADFVDTPFPLNDGEWTEMIRREGPWRRAP